MSPGTQHLDAVPGLGGLDLAIVGLYLAASVLVGWVSSRRITASAVTWWRAAASALRSPSPP